MPSYNRLETVTSSSPAVDRLAGQRADWATKTSRQRLGDQHVSATPDEFPRCSSEISVAAVLVVVSRVQERRVSVGHAGPFIAPDVGKPVSSASTAPIDRPTPGRSRHGLPAAGAPLGQRRALGAQRRVLPMARSYSVLPTLPGNSRVPAGRRTIGACSSGDLASR